MVAKCCLIVFNTIWFGWPFDTNFTGKLYTFDGRDLLEFFLVPPMEELDFLAGKLSVPSWILLMSWSTLDVEDAGDDVDGGELLLIVVLLLPLLVVACLPSIWIICTIWEASDDREGTELRLPTIFTAEFESVLASCLETEAARDEGYCELVPLRLAELNFLAVLESPWLPGGAVARCMNTNLKFGAFADELPVLAVSLSGLRSDWLKSFFRVALFIFCLLIVAFCL